MSNVRRLALAIRDGVSHPATLQEFLGVDPRHFNYYRQASEILGLVETSSGDGQRLVLTGLGDRLLATSEGSVDERAVFRQAVLAAPALRPFHSFFAGEPLTVEALADRLCALTGMAPSTAERRARTLVQWRRYLDAEEEDGEQPQIPMLGDQLERIVAHHNAVAKQRVLDWLAKVPPARFERLAAELMIAMGYDDVEIVGGSGDGGVDILAEHLDRWGHRVSVVVQAKRWSRAVGRRVIDEMIGVLVRRRVAHCIIVTTSDFSKAAREAAGADPRLRLVDGAQLVELMAAHAVVVGLGRHGEIVPRFDESIKPPPPRAWPGTC